MWSKRPSLYVCKFTAGIPLYAVVNWRTNAPALRRRPIWAMSSKLNHQTHAHVTNSSYSCASRPNRVLAANDAISMGGPNACFELS